MKYFKANNKEYCISWKYYTGRHSIDILESQQTESLLHKDIFDFFVTGIHFNYDDDAFQNQVLFTECILAEVKSSIVDGKLTNREYIPVSHAIARRSAKDHHVKKIARKVTVGRLLKMNFDDSIKSELLKVVDI